MESSAAIETAEINALNENGDQEGLWHMRKKSLFIIHTISTVRVIGSICYKNKQVH